MATLSACPLTAHVTAQVRRQGSAYPVISACPQPTGWSGRSDRLQAWRRLDKRIDLQWGNGSRPADRHSHASPASRLTNAQSWGGSLSAQPKWWGRSSPCHREHVGGTSQTGTRRCGVARATESSRSRTTSSTSRARALAIWRLPRAGRQAGPRRRPCHRPSFRAGNESPPLAPGCQTTSKSRSRFSGPFAMPAIQCTSSSLPARRNFVVRFSSSSKATAIWIRARCAPRHR